MYCKHWMPLLVFLAIGALGCGGSGETPEDTQGEGGTSTGQSSQGAGAANAETPDPDEGPRTAVTLFLEAMRRGDDAATLAMITPLARREVAKLGEWGFAPKGSDTLEFTVGDVEYLNQTGAQVAATLTDFIDAEHRRTEKVIWMVRWTGHEEGWRVAGFAAEFKAGEPPRHVNFEAAAETRRQLDQLASEAGRREAEAALTTQRNNPNAPPLR